MPGYVEFAFRTTSARFTAGRLTVHGTASFTVGGRGKLASALTALQQRGYKVGIRLKRGQEFQRRGFLGDFGTLTLRRDAGVTRELRRTFGEASGDKWVGFVADPPLRLKPRGRGRTFSFDTAFTLTNFRAEPQLLVLVYTYRDVAFSRHYLLGVRILTKGRPLAEARIRAVL